MIRDLTHHHVPGASGDRLGVRVATDPGGVSLVRYDLAYHGQHVARLYFEQREAATGLMRSGVTEEALLAVLKDRLEGRLKAAPEDRYLADALAYVGLALQALHRRSLGMAKSEAPRVHQPQH